MDDQQLKSTLLDFWATNKVKVMVGAVVIFVVGMIYKLFA